MLEDFEFTLAVIKPDSFVNKNVGAILDRLMTLPDVKIVKMSYSAGWTREFARLFYVEHEGKPFYDTLVDFMRSGPTLAIVLAGPRVVSKLRETVGSTMGASPGTLRGDFGNPDVSYENAIHASDSLSSASREIGLLFGVTRVLDHYGV